MQCYEEIIQKNLLIFTQIGELLIGCIEISLQTVLQTFAQDTADTTL